MFLFSIYLAASCSLLQQTEIHSRVISYTSWRAGVPGLSSFSDGFPWTHTHEYMNWEAKHLLEHINCQWLGHVQRIEHLAMKRKIRSLARIFKSYDMPVYHKATNTPSPCWCTLKTKQTRLQSVGWPVTSNV